MSPTRGRLPFLQIELFHSIDQCASANVQVPSRLRLIPIESFKCSQQQLSLDALQADSFFGQLQQKCIRRRRWRFFQFIGKILPCEFIAIFFLLFLLFGSLRLAMLIILVLPFASIGGIVSLFLTGEYLSVPASVGFIALWGIAVLNGVVLVSYIRNLRRSGVKLREAITEGARLRFRPVMMTASVAALGLIPFLFAKGPGSEVQRPLAIVVIGGLVTSTLLTLVVLPTLYRFFDDVKSEETMPSEVAELVSTNA